MKVEIFVDTNEFAHLAWPDGVPIPNAGDEVLMQLKPNGVASFIVEKRFFGIGTGIDGQPLTKVRIQGRAVQKND